MKYIWEPEDFDGDSGCWGLMAKRGEEIIIIGGKNVTSLRDGHIWSYENFEEMAKSFNEAGYIPVLAPVNPSLMVKHGIENKFNYGSGFGKK